MPSASQELRDKWGIEDYKACKYLRSKGYILTRGWQWIKPTSDHRPTDEEISAIRFLIDEWDYGSVQRPEDDDR